MFSSLKPNGLQRSRSSSSIALPSRPSRLPLRGSTQKNRGKSLSRQPQEKMSLDRNFTRSRSNSNLSELPGLSRQGSGSLMRHGSGSLMRQDSGSLIRQTLRTPLSQIGNRNPQKSPLMLSVKKENRPITDKRWQYDQIVKIRNFVAEHFTHLDHSNIKTGIPLELFVALMECYFKLIDKRITITRENYIEEVPSNLRRYRYPASVKPSLMKTVNTSHAWPHVLAMFSWLTNIIYEINIEKEVEIRLFTIADRCAFDLYNKWNNCQEDIIVNEDPLMEIDSKLVGILDIREGEVQELQTELENLEREKVVYKQRISDIKEKVETSRANINTTNGKCDRYLNEKQEFETSMKQQQDNYTTKLKQIDQDLLMLHKTEEQLKSVIASQPHTYSDKRQLTEEVTALQNTVKLKEERQEQQRELITTYDFIFSDLKQKVEADAYKYNNIINQLELHNPEFKKLHIQESGFARKDTEEETEEVNRLLNVAIIKFKEELKVCNKRIEELLLKDKQIADKTVAMKREVDELLKLDAELSITLTYQRKKDKSKKEELLVQLEKIENKFLKLKSSRYDLTPLQNELKRLEKEQQEHQKFNEELKENALEFFINLKARTSNNLESCMKVMAEINEAVVSAQEHAIEDSKTRLRELKKAREEAESKANK